MKVLDCTNKQLRLSGTVLLYHSTRRNRTPYNQSSTDKAREKVFRPHLRAVKSAERLKTERVNRARYYSARASARSAYLALVSAISLAISLAREGQENKEEEKEKVPWISESVSLRAAISRRVRSIVKSNLETFGSQCTYMYVCVCVCVCVRITRCQLYCPQSALPSAPLLPLVDAPLPSFSLSLSSSRDRASTKLHSAPRYYDV